MTQSATENLGFCEALRAIKAGKLVQRQGWNGKGLWVFMKPGSVHGPYLGFSLGQKVAPEHPSTVDGISLTLFNTDGADGTAMRYPQLCITYPTGTFGAWAPSQTDMLASDWRVAENDQEFYPESEWGKAQ